MNSNANGISSTNANGESSSGDNSIKAFSFKVVLLGEGCVGKTSLILRYVEDKFNDKHESTLQASFTQKKLNIEGRRITLAIWDTAGQEKFHALGPIYYRHSNGAILVYDITDKQSFEKVKIWVKELKKMLGNEISLTICGNKSDLRERNVEPEEAENYATLVGAKHFYTSAKLNHNIEQVFLELIDRMVAANSGAEKKAPTRRNVVVVEQELPPSSPPSKIGCCG